MAPKAKLAVAGPALVTVDVPKAEAAAENATGAAALVLPNVAANAVGAPKAEPAAKEKEPTAIPVFWLLLPLALAEPEENVAAVPKAALGIESVLTTEEGAALMVSAASFAQLALGAVSEPAEPNTLPPAKENAGAAEDMCFEEFVPPNVNTGGPAEVEPEFELEERLDEDAPAMPNVNPELAPDMETEPKEGVDEFEGTAPELPEKTPPLKERPVPFELAVVVVDEAVTDVQAVEEPEADPVVGTGTASVLSKAAPAPKVKAVKDDAPDEPASGFFRAPNVKDEVMGMVPPVGAAVPRDKIGPKEAVGAADADFEFTTRPSTASSSSSSLLPLRSKPMSIFFSGKTKPVVTHPFLAASAALVAARLDFAGAAAGSATDVTEAPGAQTDLTWPSAASSSSISLLPLRSKPVSSLLSGNTNPVVTHPFLAASAALAACGLDGRGAAALVTSLEGETAFLDPKEGELNAGDLAAVVVLTPKVNPEDDDAGADPADAPEPKTKPVAGPKLLKAVVTGALEPN